MRKNTIRLNESQLQQIVRETVDNIQQNMAKQLTIPILKENISGYDSFEHQDLIDKVDDCYENLKFAIRNLAKYYLTNVEGSNDKYNSYAGKYSSEALQMIQSGLSILGSMMETNE